MSIQRYDVVGYGQQDIVRSEKGEFVDFDDHCKEIDRLTRELTEAEARALPDGWVAVPDWKNVTVAMLEEIQLSKNFTFEALQVRYRAMIAARPELPKQESSNVE